MALSPQPFNGGNSVFWRFRQPEFKVLTDLGKIPQVRFFHGLDDHSIS